MILELGRTISTRDALFMVRRAARRAALIGTLAAVSIIPGQPIVTAQAGAENQGDPKTEDPAQSSTVEGLRAECRDSVVTTRDAYAFKVHQCDYFNDKGELVGGSSSTGTDDLVPPKNP